jgi:hypothetical protein
MVELPPYPVVRRRNRRYFTLVLLVVLLIGGWIGFWYYAEGRIERSIDGWKAREARAGRLYECGSQTVGGFPFRFEVLCDQARATLTKSHPPAELTAPNIHIAAQVYDPTLLIAEIAGPATYAEPGQPPSYVANWTLAQSSVRGTPREPQRVSIVIDGLNVKRTSPEEPVVDATRLEIHGRMLEGSAQANPVIEIALRSTKLAAPVLGTMAAKPTDSEIDVVLRGLKDFSPKPWPDRGSSRPHRAGRHAGGRQRHADGRGGRQARRPAQRHGGRRRGADQRCARPEPEEARLQHVDRSRPARRRQEIGRPPGDFAAAAAA